MPGSAHHDPEKPPLCDTCGEEMTWERLDHPVTAVGHGSPEPASYAWVCLPCRRIRRRQQARRDTEDREAQRARQQSQRAARTACLILLALATLVAVIVALLIYLAA